MGAPLAVVRPHHRANDVDAHRLAVDPLASAELLLPIERENAAVGERARYNLGIEALTKNTPPDARRDQPLPIVAIATHPPQAIRYWPGVRGTVYWVEARIAVALKQSTNLLDSAADFARIITPIAPPVCKQQSAAPVIHGRTPS